MKNTDEATLLHRALERTASLEDWDEIHSLASQDPKVWERLGQDLYEETLVRGVVEVNLNAPMSSSEFHTIREIANRSASRVITLPRRWVWLAAVFLMVASLTIGASVFPFLSPGKDVGFNTGQGDDLGDSQDDSERAASLLRLFSELDEVFEKNLLPASWFVSDAARVRELPPMLMERSAIEGEDAMEILIMRCFIERKRVGEMYQLTLDEHGIPEPIAVQLASLNKAISF